MRNWNSYFEQQLFPLLPAYPWGIETPIIPSIWPVFLLPAYLWGIETKRMTLWVLLRYCYQPTYEELKHVSREYLLYSCSSPPAYLWGIETNLAECLPTIILLQPTYEELKPSNILAPSAMIRGYQPNEELKLPRRTRPKRQRGRYQPTYEELKRSAAPVWRTKRRGLPAYLWGIETGSHGEGEEVLQLPAYLWGIGTGKCGLVGKAVSSYQPTYEELKPDPALDKGLPGTPLPAYLGGIETAAGINISSKARTLPAYLWGIETHKKIWTRSWRLPAYLWGIELKRSADLVADHVTSLPMRNWNCKALTKVFNTVSYQPTYEELKHGLLLALAPAAALPAYLWGIETLLHSSLSKKVRSGYQPTYEELKHF